MNERSCGPCQMCCVVLSIEEIQKPLDKPCANLCTAGCGIYQTRPTTCRDFACSWLMGEFQDQARPDIVGWLAFEHPHDPQTVVVHLGANCVEDWHLDPNLRSTPLDKRVLVASHGKLVGHRPTNEPDFYRRDQNPDMYIGDLIVLRWSNL